jgi:integrase
MVTARVNHDTDLWTVCTEYFFPLRLSIRAKNTRNQYAYACNDFAAVLGRRPTMADLSDDNLVRLTHYLLGPDRNLAERSANERVGRLKSLWNWLAKRGELRTFPTVLPVPEPERIPRAWDTDQLRRLFLSFEEERGMIFGITAKVWWFTLHAWLWNTGERKGATFALRWEHLDLERAVATVPAKIRKGHRKSAVYWLWPQTVKLLAAFRHPPREIVFPLPGNAGSDDTFYHSYRRILRRAGLPDDRYSKMQAMRVSYATWLKAAGGDATTALMHSSDSVTRQHYLDPRLLADRKIQLFCPWESNGHAAVNGKEGGAT